MNGEINANAARKHKPSATSTKNRIHTGEEVAKLAMAIPILDRSPEEGRDVIVIFPSNYVASLSRVVIYTCYYPQMTQINVFTAAALHWGWARIQ